MIAKHYKDVPLEREANAQKAGIRWLISKKEGAENFAMRMIEVEPGGSTPFHSHPWEHEVYVVEGESIVQILDEYQNIKEGYIVFVPSGIKHTFKNSGKKVMKMICVIPLEK